MANTSRHRYFLVERYLPSIGEDVEPALARLDEAGDGAVRHLCSLFVRQEETCLSVFEAADAASVADANARARVRLDRIVEVEVFHGAQSARSAS
jgi:hypothetical protein